MSNLEINKLIVELTAHFKRFAVPEDAPAMKKYMKNRFEFLGLKKDIREAATKSFWAINKLPEDEDLKALVKAIWQQPYRELHYMALQLLVKPIKKADESWIELLEFLIVNQSWWDSVDIVAAKLIGAYLKKHKNINAIYPNNWIASDNMWLRRTAILYQLKYKEKTDTDRLFDYILQTAQEKEFFIQKAQGWSLREYAKTDMQAVVDFVKSNKEKLSNLTKKEALKHCK
jgi:3-methyladenine DNA glycosylase AlkD